MAHAGWTRDQLLLAMNLYYKLPFGRLHHRNPSIIKLAEAIGRTPNAVAMKLSNLASLDPELQARGIRGLVGASAADRRMWDEFHADWDRMAVESESAYQRLLAPPATPAPEVPVAFTGPTTVTRQVEVRLAQRFFRKTVLASYGYRCCISGLAVPQLLIASHIVPWSAHPEERTNPKNGLCLSRLHDAAFDRGLIAFDDEHRLLISGRLRESAPDETLTTCFFNLAGQSLRTPDRFEPDGEFLRTHREEVFLGA